MTDHYDPREETARAAWHGLQAAGLVGSTSDADTETAVALLAAFINEHERLVLFDLAVEAQALRPEGTAAHRTTVARGGRRFHMGEGGATFRL